jgi:thiol-disulfide isomerase/thioredoxin
MLKIIAIIVVVIMLLLFFYYNKKEFLTAMYKPTVVLHSTKWCPACKMVKPLWEELKKDEGSNYNFIENDEDLNPTQSVTSFPTFSLIVGNRRHFYKGERSLEMIKKWLFLPQTDTY